jgi:hypothetical protein
MAKVKPNDQSEYERKLACMTAFAASMGACVEVSDWTGNSSRSAYRYIKVVVDVPRDDEARLHEVLKACSAVALQLDAYLTICGGNWTVGLAVSVDGRTVKDRARSKRIGEEVIYPNVKFSEATEFDPKPKEENR